MPAGGLWVLAEGLCCDNLGDGTFLTLSKRVEENGSLGTGARCARVDANAAGDVWALAGISASDGRALGHGRSAGVYLAAHLWTQ